MIESDQSRELDGNMPSQNPETEANATTSRARYCLIEKHRRIKTDDWNYYCLFC